MKSLIIQKDAEKINKRSRTGAIAKVTSKRIKVVLKIGIFISMIIAINVISNKLTNLAVQLTYTQIKIMIFTSIVTFILYIYLKSCEEVKQILEN